MIDIRTEVISAAKAVVLVVAALFPIVNPLGSAAIFLSMVGTVSQKTQIVLSRKISIFSFLLLLGSLLFGAKVLLFFGVSLYAVQIGGGLIVTATGWVLLNQSGSGAASRPATEDDILANAFYPYTLPITVGPGSISVAVTLGAHLPSELGARSILSPAVFISALLGIVLVCLIIYICYRYAAAAERLLGSSGTTVLMRLSSFILLCIGVQIVSTGIRAYLETLKGF
jgi:multiple antibiotic resistance protein